MNADDKKILARKRIEMRFSQSRRKLTSRAAIHDLWWAYMKHGVIDMADWHRFKVSNGYFKKIRNIEDLSCNS